MIIDLRLEIYPPTINFNNDSWIIAGFYDDELEVLDQFTIDKDYIIYHNWDGGKDILINSKVLTWLSLKYSQPISHEYDNPYSNDYATYLLSLKLSA